MRDALGNNAKWASTVTVITVLLLVAAKSVAYYLSDSAAVLSSLVDSVSDIGMSVMTWLSIRWSLKPADDDHRHGHGKIEAVAALFQSAVLTGAAFFLVFTAVGRFLQPVDTVNHLFTIALMSLSLLSSAFLTFIQNRANRSGASLALQADQAHYATDIWLNGIVIVVVMLDYMNMSPVWFDPFCTVLIAGLFASAAYKIARKSIHMLMDREVEPAIRDRISDIVTAPADVKGIHDLRVTRSGMKIVVSFDMEVDGNLTLCAAHEIAQEAEYRILREFPNAEILIHLDPEGEIEDSRHGEVIK